MISTLNLLVVNVSILTEMIYRLQNVHGFIVPYRPYILFHKYISLVVIHIHKEWLLQIGLVFVISPCSCAASMNSHHECAWCRNSKRMAVNGMVERFCKEEDVGYMDLWDSFVGNEDMYVRDGLHLSGKGAAVFAEGLSGAVASGLGKVRYLN